MCERARRLEALAALVVFGCWAFGGEDASVREATALARERWKAHFRELSAIRSPRLRAVLGDCPIYRATVFNPISMIAGRPTFLHALVLRPDGPVFVEKDQDAAALLSQCKPRAAEAGAALNLALAFGELRNYPLQTRVRGRGTVAAHREDWAVIIEESRDGWTVGCTFLVDPTIRRCCRYRLAITRNGRLSAQPGKTVFAVGGYR